jgi:hypothetical protein
MNWFIENWYWIALGAAVLIYVMGRRRGTGRPHAVGDDQKGLIEADGDPTKRPRRRHGCC